METWVTLARVPNIGPIELFVILIFVLIAYGIGKAAERKSQSFWGFFVFGLVIWPLALVIVLLVPERRDTGARRPREGAPDHLDRLQKLTALRATGALSDEEFQAEKARILRTTAAR